MARLEKVRLGDLLVQQGLITQDQLMAALAEQKRSGRKLGRIFVDSSFVTEEGLSQALAKQLRIPFIDLKSYNVDAALAQMLPEGQARRFRAVVLENRGSTLLVALADPTDLLVYDELTRILKHEIDQAVVTESQLLATIDRIYRRTEEISGLAKELTAEMGDAPVDFGDLMGGVSSTPGLEEAPVVKLLQTMFEDAVAVRASDVHIEPQESRLRIRFRIDGMMHIQTETDPKIASALVLRMKLMSGLDISEKRLPQDGRFAIRVRNNPIDVRISTLPTQYGESVVMRLLNQNTGLLGLNSIGMPPHVLERVKHAIHRPHGMVLVTGPTGSGKTTTLYSALKDINTPDKKIITVEDPVEYRLPGLNQVQINDKIDLSFARVLRSALRQDPDVVLVGEMRDQTTAEIGLRAALTGHMVLSTLHTNDALSTPMRLLDMGVPRFMVALALQLVLAQRLVRVICASCIQPYTPLPNEREWLRYELGERVDQHHYMHGAGCQQCNNTGYSGRIAVYEMLEMTDAVVQAVHQGDPVVLTRVGREQMGGNTLRRDAVRLVLAKSTTIEEAMRIASEGSD